MGKRIHVEYNPYLKKSHIHIEGSYYLNTGKLSEHIEDHDMGEWLFPHRVSYQNWNGFLPELMLELNEDELDIIFAGAPRDYEIFRESIQEQDQEIGQYGFEPGRCTVAFQEKFSDSNIQELLTQHRKNMGNGHPEMLWPLTPETVVRMMTLDEKLFGSMNLSEMELNSLRKDYLSVYQEIVESKEWNESKAEVKEKWCGAQRELKGIFEQADF